LSGLDAEDFMGGTTAALRDQIARILDWHDAHVDFDSAVKDVPVDRRGAVPPGSAHSIWQLVEHLRLAQHDILDFCVNPSYEEMAWPDDYWPKEPAPPTSMAWDESLAMYRRDRAAMQALVKDPAIDLFAQVPQGTGQTFLREALLVADHAAYHIGQIVFVRRQLGIWGGGKA
jgi:uncharacterized damage-inducible protein DinB